MKRNNTEGTEWGITEPMCRKWIIERLQIVLRGRVRVNAKDSCKLTFKA